MSLKAALTWTLLATSLAGRGAIAFLGVRSIRTYVVREAQARVDHDLDVLGVEYERRFARLEKATIRDKRGYRPTAS